MRPTRDQIYLEIAYTIARRGTCPRRQVGCVLTDPRGRILSTGYNGVASGRPHCNDPLEAPSSGCLGRDHPPGEGLDACEAIHAEQNAILLLPDPFRVDTAYVTASPCLSCIKLLLGTSCRRLVVGELYPHPRALEWWGSSGRDLIHLPEIHDKMKPAP